MKMATCKTPRSAGSGLRERLSLTLMPTNLMSARVAYAAAWGNGPLSAGPIPDSSPDWTSAFDDGEYGFDQPVQKRSRRACEVEKPSPPVVESSRGTDQPTSPTERPTIRCDELSNLLSTTPKCGSNRGCSVAPIVLDLRRLPSQMCCRIKSAVGMPCESRVKMRLVLPHLDAYLRRHLTHTCPDCAGPLDSEKQLVVLCTETGSEHTPVSDGLLLHLPQHHAVDVKLLKGGFHEFRSLHPHLCEKALDRLTAGRSGSSDTNVRSASTPPEFPNNTPETSSPIERPMKHRGSGSTDSNSFLLPGSTFSFESVHGINGLYSSASNLFPRYLVSPISMRKSSEFIFPCEEELHTHKDVFRVKASRILPFLYLGNEIDCSSEQFLDSNRIRSVLNVTNKVPFLDEKRFRCCRLPAIDMQTQDLRPLFTSAFEFIEQSREAGDSVLVHCQAGISRSPALVIAYLMAHSGLSLRDAYRWVKSKRSVISPNFAFLGQLCDFEADLMAGRVPRKPDVLNGLIPVLEESREVDDFLSLSLDGYSARTPAVESTDSASPTCTQQSKESPTE